MHETSPILAAVKREKLGTRYCERLRKQGKLPAVVYGKGHAPISLAFDMRDATAQLHKGEKIFRIDLPGVFTKQVALIKDLQFDHLGTRIVHADFESVALTDRIKTRVPIHLTGDAKGLKQVGAILLHPTAEVTVECVVSELPEFVEVDINELDVGHAITAADLKFSSKSLKLLTDSHAMIAQIFIQLEVKTGEAAVVGTGGAEPEVLTAKKADDAAAAKPGAKAPAGKAPAGKDAAKPAAKPAGKDKK